MNRGLVVSMGGLLAATVFAAHHQASVNKTAKTEAGTAAIAEPGGPSASAASLLETVAEDAANCDSDDYAGCNAVGVIDVFDESGNRAPNFTRCIVTLINRRLALTANHCFAEPPVIFDPGCRFPVFEGRRMTSRKCKATVEVGDSVYGVTRVVQVDKSDAVLVVLDKNVDAWLPLDPAIDTAQAKRPVAIGLNVSTEPAVDESIVSRNCTIKGGRYRCDVTPGFSGGPVTDKSGAFFGMVTGKRADDAGVVTGIIWPSAIGATASSSKLVPSAPSALPLDGAVGFDFGMSSNVVCKHGSASLSYVATNGKLTHIVPGTYSCRAQTDTVESLPAHLKYQPDKLSLEKALALFDPRVDGIVGDATLRQCATGSLGGLDTSRCSCGPAKLSIAYAGVRIADVLVDNTFDMPFQTAIVDAAGLTVDGIKQQYRQWFVAPSNDGVQPLSALLSRRFAILARGLTSRQTIRCTGLNVESVTDIDAPANGCAHSAIILATTPPSTDAATDSGDAAGDSVSCKPVAL